MGETTGHGTRWRSRMQGPVGALAALGAAFVLSGLAPSTGAAQEYDAPRKLGRGVANLGLGVLALPGEVVDTTREKGPFVGVTWGVVKGVGVMVATEVVGLWEILTCPYEFPPDWKPILTPEFPWQRFQERDDPAPARRPSGPRVR